MQFGDVIFYKFLLSLGLTPAKSKTLRALKIPQKYFFDFLRGSFDGDGSLYAYWDKRWRSSFLFYLTFNSGSLDHLVWLRKKLKKLIGIKGQLSNCSYGRLYQLKYAKKEARIILNKIYYSPKVPKLERKFKKVYSVLNIDQNNYRARVL